MRRAPVNAAQFAGFLQDAFTSTTTTSTMYTNLGEVHNGNDSNTTQHKESAAK
jgi:hypothetical protein